MGSELAKTRPCIVVSPDEMNRHLKTVIVAPITSALKGWPSRVPCVFRRRRGEVALDQIRAIAHSRIVKHLGTMDGPTSLLIRNTLIQMFS